MSDVKWIKISTNIFDDEKILLIEGMPEKYTIITCWFKLLCLAGKSNNSGVFVLNDKIAYNDEMLASIFRMPVSSVRLSLNTFQNFGMIELIDGVITIPNWDKHQSLESYEKKKEYDRQYQAQKRLEKQKIVENRTTNRTSIVLLDKDIDIEEDKDIDKDIPPLPPTGETWNFDKHTNVENAEHIVNEKAITPELADIIRTWMSYKDEKKPRATHHYVEKGISSLLARFEKAYNEYGAAELNRVVEDSISNNYSGIVWDRLSKQKQTAEDKSQAWLDAWRNA